MRFEYKNYTGLNKGQKIPEGIDKPTRNFT